MIFLGFFSNIFSRLANAGGKEKSEIARSNKSILWKVTTYLLANIYFSVFECYWISSLDNNPVNPLTKELFNKIPEGGNREVWGGI